MNDETKDKKTGREREDEDENDEEMLFRSLPYCISIFSELRRCPPLFTRENEVCSEEWEERKRKRECRKRKQRTYIHNMHGQTDGNNNKAMKQNPDRPLSLLSLIHI